MAFTIDDARKQAKEAIITHLLRRTVGIINEVRFEGTVNGHPYSEEESGTGCLVQWNSRLVILTARHVVKSALVPKNVRATSFAQGPTRFRPLSEVTLSDTDVGENLAGSDMYFCEWEDLAVITLPDERLGEFAEINQRWIDPQVGDFV